MSKKFKNDNQRKAVMSKYNTGRAGKPIPSNYKPPIKKTYIFHSDPGHGWLEVDRSELKRLGIENKISECSYRRGNKVFLEEDCDATVFLEAKKQHGEPFDFEERYEEHTPIRNYNYYK